VYASKRRKVKFSGPGENCQINVTDLSGSLVTSSRPLGVLQKRPDNRTSNAGVTVRTPDGSWRTADAADKQCLRCGYYSPSCTVANNAYNTIIKLLAAKIRRRPVCCMHRVNVYNAHNAEWQLKLN